MTETLEDGDIGDDHRSGAHGMVRIMEALKCGFQTSSNSFTWELLEMQNPEAQPRPIKICIFTKSQVIPIQVQVSAALLRMLLRAQIHEFPGRSVGSFSVKMSLQIEVLVKLPRFTLYALVIIVARQEFFEVLSRINKDPKIE